MSTTDIRSAKRPDWDKELVAILPEMKLRRAYWMVTHESSRPLRHVAAVQDFLRDQVARDKSIF